jgi:hypothetical protein
VRMSPRGGVIEEKQEWSEPLSLITHTLF